MTKQEINKIIRQRTKEVKIGSRGSIGQMCIGSIRKLIHLETQFGLEFHFFKVQDTRKVNGKFLRACKGNLFVEVIPPTDLSKFWNEFNKIRY